MDDTRHICLDAKSMVGVARGGSEMATYKALILGEIWMPPNAKCSLEQVFQADWDKQALDLAYSAGDFQHVDDVQLWKRETCSHGFSGYVLVRDWEKGEESEIVYSDTVSEYDC